MTVHFSPLLIHKNRHGVRYLLFCRSLVSFFWPFHTVHGVLKARILKWFAIPFSSGSHLVRTLHHDMIHSFIECRWHHTYGKKWRRTKEPLDESERGEGKSWLQAQHSENEDHGILFHHFMASRWGNSGNSDKTLFSWAPKSLQMVTAAMKLKDSCSLKEKLWPT